MCYCGKPVINGQVGFKYDFTGGTAIHPVNPPALEENETILYDEPGRCGGQDSHAYHYIVVRSGELLVRHGGGDERVRLSNAKAIIPVLAALDSNARYWTLNAIYHAHAYGRRDGQEKEASKWRNAAANKLIKTRKQRGGDSVKVWIEPATV